ncbi:MAG TPA: hypothetical protein VK364_08225, partial [Hymenobacter sp.]|jgi:hypothetical protein|nr:hypothetical protein [Hymenobacter sp.]HLL94769.1 hypothetical protein [Spirosoma sp.]
MNSIIFRIDADKIGPNLTDSIKAYFGNRQVQIIVKADETAADVPARDDAENHKDYALPYDDIARIADALDRNESVDVAAEMKKFMETK